MKIAVVEDRGERCWAVVEADAAYILGPVKSEPNPTGRSREDLTSARDAAQRVAPLTELILLPSAGRASKLICLGRNYRNHVEEINADLPENPSAFIKLPDALVGQDQPIVRPKVSTSFDYEGEICAVIGRAGRHIERDKALDHVFGYTIMLDGSVRDYQKHSVTAGKNFWRSGSLGPWIVTSDQVGDPAQLRLETRLNGEVVQSTMAYLMLYDIPTAIAYVSRWTPLAPGDVIATGTPGGVGSRRTPPLWMKHGDVIEISVSGVGTLRNTVVDEPQ